MGCPQTLASGQPSSDGLHPIHESAPDSRAMPPTSSRSLVAIRAILAVALMVSFYLLTLGIVLGILWMLYGLAASELRYFDNNLSYELVLLVLAVAGGVLWSLLPQIDDFQPPGPRLDLAEHPRLQGLLEDMARATGQRVPKEVYLLPSTAIWIASRGGAMGLGSRRVMGVGLLALQQLTPAEVGALVAHELAHRHRGGPLLGAWVHRTRSVLGRTIAALRDDPWALHVLFEGYGNAFLKLTTPVARQQELHADALAASIAGTRAMTEALAIIDDVAPHDRAYVEQAVLPVLRRGLRPPMADGFSSYLNGELDSVLEHGLVPTTPEELDSLDAHPPLEERLAGLNAGGIAEPPPTEESALDLLGDLDGVERDLAKHLRSAFTRREYELITWEEWQSRAEAPARSRKSRARGGGLRLRA